MSRWCPEYAPTCPACNIEKLKERTSRRCQKCSRHPGWHLRNVNKNVPNLRISSDDEHATALDTLADDLLSTLRKSPQSLESLATMLKVTPGQALDALIALREKGVNLHSIDGKWSLEKTPEPNQATFEYVSRPDNTFHFGCVSDTHLCSKYAREDVLSDLYNEFRTAGVDRVFHGGNWIEGDNENNRFDVSVHGLEPQVAYLVKHYPQRDGIVTYAIWGEDHEGFYARREAVNVGKTAERMMREAGREDWVNLGFMESRICLVNANTGKQANLLVMHSGGGSSYAISYRWQKIIECVPLDSEILTRVGWRQHDAVSVGHEVLGYNIETDRCEWTTVTAVNYGESELVRYHNDQFDVRCTVNHRWIIERERQYGHAGRTHVKDGFTAGERHLWTIDESVDRSRVIQAAMAPDGPGICLSEHHQWLDRTNAEQTVLRMTSGERKGFIEGMLLGEGTIANGASMARTIVFSQRPGPVHDAFRLACFLEGVTTTSREAPAGSFKPDGPPARRVTVLKKRRRIVSRIKRESVGEHGVWCPTTALGTWVMRQGDLITITGNSLQGGAKPAVLLLGHYHKLGAIPIRNVWTIGMASTKDQDPFLRKHSIDSVVGGVIVTLRQDPHTGAIHRCLPDMMQYFDREYENDRWSHSGPVVQPEKVGIGT